MTDFRTNTLFRTSTIADGNMSFRVGDTANVLQNRTKFLLKNEINFTSNICMKCNHGEVITPVNWSNPGVGATTQDEMFLSEVLITQERGLALMLLTADCLPVSFYDPVTQTIALAHCSRQTIAQLLPEQTIRFLQEHFEVTPANLLIHIGPHIHTHSYSFPLPQPDLPQPLSSFVYKTETHVSIDLVGACIKQLITSETDAKNISVSEINTATSADHYSHYQSKKQNTPEGRLATVLMLLQ